MKNNLTVSEIMDLISRSFPELSISSLSVNNTGWDNIIAVVNHSIVFRFPKYLGSEKSMRREIKLLSLLQGFPVALPKYAFFPASGKFFAGYRFIPGEHLNKAATIGKGLMRDLIAILHFLRDVEVSDVKDSGIRIYGPKSWLKREKAILGSFEESLGKLTGDSYFSMLREDMEAFLSEINESAFSLIHGDLYRGNVLISARHDRINGVIDWGDASVGDYAFDIAAVGLDFPERYTRKITSIFGDDDITIEKRIAFYRRLEPLYLADNLARKGHQKEALNILHEIGSRKPRS
jgi:aminoglycoside 2''-phosphotransferase